jgi:hypothetical protein
MVRGVAPARRRAETRIAPVTISTDKPSETPDTEQAISARVLIGLLLLAAVAAGILGYALFIGQGVGGD